MCIFEMCSGAARRERKFMYVCTYLKNILVRGVERAMYVHCVEWWARRYKHVQVVFRETYVYKCIYAQTFVHNYHQSIKKYYKYMVAGYHTYLHIRNVPLDRSLCQLTRNFCHANDLNIQIS